jgi:hypothetical protein
LVQLILFHSIKLSNFLILSREKEGLVNAKIWVRVTLIRAMDCFTTIQSPIVFKRPSLRQLDLREIFFLFSIQEQFSGHLLLSFLNSFMTALIIIIWCWSIHNSESPYFSRDFDSFFCLLTPNFFEWASWINLRWLKTLDINLIAIITTLRIRGDTARLFRFFFDLIDCVGKYHSLSISTLHIYLPLIFGYLKILDLNFQIKEVFSIHFNDDAQISISMLSHS